MRDYLGKEANILRDKKLYLFDMDGTIYLGYKLFDGVKQLLDKIEKEGKKYLFITNNSSKSVDSYVEKMHKLGLFNVKKDNFYTSVDAAISIMKERHLHDLIYLQGTKSFISQLKNEGFNITTAYSDDIKVVLVGYDSELTSEKLETTCKVLTNLDVSYYATNPDWVCPTEFGYVPDCGSMCFGIEKATGKSPVFIGKPQPDMILNAIKKYGCKREDAVVIGDRLYTDIKSGNNAGVTTICVLSGEVNLKDIEKAQGKEIPDFVFERVKDLIQYFI